MMLLPANSCAKPLVLGSAALAYQQAQAEFAAFAEARSPFKHVTKIGSAPVLAPVEEWEGTVGVYDSKILMRGTSLYMFHSAVQSGGEMSSIGYATADVSDPTTWTNGPLVFAKGGQPGIDDGSVSSLSPIQRLDGSYYGTYQAWGADAHLRACAATCTEAAFPDFAPIAGNPVIPVSSGLWDSQHVKPEIIFPAQDCADGRDHIVYGGSIDGTNDNYRGGHASAAAGGLAYVRRTTWPALAPGPAGSWMETAVHPVGQGLTLVIEGVRIHYFPFQGYRKSVDEWRVGIGCTGDFKSFHKFANWIIGPGAAGAWDAGYAENAGFWWDGETVWLYYTGAPTKGIGVEYRIGLATAHAD